MIFLFQTPLVPKKNSFRAGVSKNGRMYQYRSKEAIVCENTLRLEAMGQMRHNGFHKLEGGIKVEAVFKKTRADCIGLMETLLDALQHVAYDNDRQVVNLSARWEVEEELKAKSITCCCKIMTEPTEIIETILLRKAKISDAGIKMFPKGRPI